MSLQYDETDAIYYDNMEIMAAYEKRKKDSVTRSDWATQKKLTTDGNTLVDQRDQPPVLPPKRKNVLKSTMPSPSQPVVKTAKSERSSPSPILPSYEQITAPQPSKKWNHPGLLRSHSIVDEPLSPIMEEEHVQRPERGKVNSSLGQSPRPDGNSQVSTRACEVPESRSKDSTDIIRGSSSRSESCITHHVPCISEKNTSPNVEENEVVRPYGMIDLTWFDNAMDLANTTQENLPSLPKRQGILDSSKQQYFRKTAPDNVAMHDETSAIHNSMRGFAGSYLDQKPEHATPATRSPTGRFSNPKMQRKVNRECITSPENSNMRGDVVQVTKERRFISTPKFDVEQADTTGVSAYMSIPIHTQKVDTDSGKGETPRSAKRVDTNKNVLRRENHLYLDDEYMYDEIVDTAQDEKIQLKSNVLKRTPEDIGQVLGSMGSENAFSPSATDFKRFPVTEEERKIDMPRYDNFQFLSVNASKRDNTFDPSPPKNQYPSNKIWNVKYAIQGNKNASYEVREFGQSESGGPTITDSPPSESNHFFRSISDGQNSVDIEDPLDSLDSTAQVFTGGSTSYHRANQERNAVGSENGLIIEAMNKGTSEEPSMINSERIDEEINEISKAGDRSTHKKTKSLGEVDHEYLSRKEGHNKNGRRDSQTSSNIFADASLPDQFEASEQNTMNSGAQLKGSTRSLGRSNSCERKKPSLRSKFKLRTRSKSQDRFHGDSDSAGGISSLSDVDDKAGTPRQRGSRLRRRLSRKSLENRGSSSLDQKCEEDDYKYKHESRPTTPVSFIRKLLGKSKNSGQVKSSSLSKVYSVPSEPEESMAGASSALSSSDRSRSLLYNSREKQLTSPPSRRARKILHTRQSRGNPASTTSTGTDSDNEMSHRHAHGSYKSEEHCERHNQSNTPPRCETEHVTRERGRKKKDIRMQFSRTKGSRRDDLHHRTDGIHSDKYRALASLNAQTLKKITEKWLTDWRNRLPVGGFLITSWSDIVIASKRPQCIIGNTVIYEAYFSTNPGHSLACQIFDKKNVSRRLIRQLENCYTLTAHPNLCSVCSHFECKVPGSLFRPSLGERHIEALCVVLANVPATSLTTYIRRLKEMKEQKEVHKQILLMLLQLLQALDNLCQSGFSFSYVNTDHLVVTQEMGLLQILPHMDGVGELATEETLSHPKGGVNDGRYTAMHHVARLVSLILEVGLDPRTMDISSAPRSSVAFSHLFALTKVSFLLANESRNLDIASLQSLVQCALWGPRTLADLGMTFENIYEALATWVDVKQAEIVNNIAVLFSAKKDFLPIHMFYKHQYFSLVDPDNLYKNLLALNRI